MMNTLPKSLFNLIQIFSTSHKTVVQTISPQKHCEEKHHHDFYCDAEKPFVTNF